MSNLPLELSVSQARDRFSETVNRAAYGGQITRITRGKRAAPAAAVVPAEWLDHYEELLDAQDGPVAAARLAEVRRGHIAPVSAAQVRETLGV
ncbi:MAG: type II toxin-antitoxin system prevent-host-death family antitoxin [Bifidobacteriaceae bacterium]|jgi:prevent-host-death family protein|nr:type II toxin-antitoxin system prevent-host-death family antitoxin [Bifidobacteriaceae bacterium]